MSESTTWTTEITAWVVAMRSMRLSSQTIGLRRYHLQRLAAAQLAPTPWHLTLNDLLDWTGAHDWSRETARSVRSSLRRFWAWGVTTGRTDRDVARDLPPIQPEQPRPRPAQPKLVTQALHGADPRLKLILRLANELGMRRGEVAQVHPERDLIEDLTGWSLHVHGKGARDRLVPLPDDLALALRTSPKGYLFPGAIDGHLSAKWVGKLVSRALADGTTMHQLRHLCATELHDQTHDLRLVQTVLGHASLTTTQRYVAVHDEHVRAAIAIRSKRWRGAA